MKRTPPAKVSRKAKLYEFVNVLSEYKPKSADELWAMREALEALVLLNNPMTPHLAEESWQTLGPAPLVVRTAWPKANPDLVRQDTVMIAIQVDGKRRDEIEMPKDSDAKTIEIAVLDRDPVRKAIDGRRLKKVIIVPNRIANVVTEQRGA